jgi:ATP-dependent protease ClpP protease subunit
LITYKNKNRRLFSADDNENVILISAPQQSGGGEPKAREIVTEGTHIYFFQDVTTESVQDLVVTLRRMTASILEFTTDLELPEPPPIHLHINTNGGDAFAGFSASFSIASNPIPVYTYVDGQVASAGTFMSLAGAKRFMQPQSFMLIHQVSSGVWGTYADIVDEKESLDRIMEKARELYKKYTKISDERLDDLLNGNLWLNAEECLELGFVDEVQKS